MVIALLQKEQDVMGDLVRADVHITITGEHSDSTAMVYLMIIANILMRI